MAFLMFVDESGQDQSDSPYEVLAGLVVHDKRMWPLTKALHESEIRHFGRRYASVERELKAKRLLKTKVFRQAALRDAIEPDRRLQLASECLTEGAGATPEQLAGLAQAKLSYCHEALAIASTHGCQAFASIAPRTAPRPTSDHLRRDYAFLFERLYFFLLTKPRAELGLVVFDELEHSQSHLLIDQMERYFMGTATGLKRSARIIPEPFFVHSHLTTGVHLADLIAYIISWGVREAGMTEPARPELKPFAEGVVALRTNIRHGTRTIWGFNVLTDLRARAERGIVVSRAVRIVRRRATGD